MRNRTPAELESKFPKLQTGNYSKTSEATGRYNCIAFANNHYRKWWESGLFGGRYHWPNGISDTLDGWVKMFTDQGYEFTNNRDIEPGFEKVAIYVDLNDQRPGHVAKSDGQSWKSKLGRYQDIEHASLALLEGDAGWEYGSVERILRRPISAPKTMRKLKQLKSSRHQRSATSG
jgi:hypothetical protein